MAEEPNISPQTIDISDIQAETSPWEIGMDNVEQDHAVDNSEQSIETLSDTAEHDKSEIETASDRGLHNITISADADTYVQGGSRNNYNNGLTKSIRIRDIDYCRAFFRFKMPEAENVQRAILRLYCTVEESTEYPLQIGVADTDDWIEGNKDQAVAEDGEICNNNAPAIPEELISVPFIPKKEYIEIDVTEFARKKLGDEMITFTLNESESNNRNIYFNSKEAGQNPPELVITTEYESIPDSIEISGDDTVSVLRTGIAEYTYSATVYDKFQQTIDEANVVWEVYEAGTRNTVKGIEIDGGVLKIDPSAKSCDVDILAIVGETGDIFASKTVHVIREEEVVVKHVVLPVDADVQIQGGSMKNTNYGASTTVQTRNDGYRKGLFRFDLTGVYGTPEKAQMSIYKSATSTEDADYALALADNDDWIEGNKSAEPAVGGEICNENAPTYTEKMNVTIPSGQGYIDFDVTEFVAKKLKDNKKISLYLAGETEGGTINSVFFSKESGKNVPKLELDMRYVPEITQLTVKGAETMVIPYSGSATEKYGLIAGDQYGEAIAAPNPVWSLKEDVSGVSVSDDGTLIVSNYALTGKVVLVAQIGTIRTEYTVELKTAQEAVDFVYEELDIGDTDYVISDLTLPQTGSFNSKIVWSSTDEDTVAVNGKVTRPDIDELYKAVTLTAIISCGGVQRTKVFNLKVIRKASVIELEPEKRGFIHTGGAARERIVNPYQTYIGANGGRKTILKFDIEKLRDYESCIEKAEVMLVPWFAQASIYRTDIINSAIISDDWDPFALGDDGQYEIDGVNYGEHIKTIENNVAKGHYDVYNNRRYVAVDLTDKLKEKMTNYPADDMRTVNEGFCSGNKFSVMLYADDVNFTSTNQYTYPILRVTLAYNGEPDDIKIEQDMYYDEKVRIPNAGTEIRRYKATAVDEIGREFTDVDDFEYKLDGAYTGVEITKDGELRVGPEAREGIVKIVCESASKNLRKVMDTELIAPIAEVSRPNLLFDKNSLSLMRQKVNSDSALLNQYKKMRASAASVNPEDISSIEKIEAEASPWVNALGQTFTAPAEAVQFEVGFKSRGQGDWELDSTSIMWVGKTSLKYDNPDFEDGTGGQPNGWRREIYSGNPDLRWDDVNNPVKNPIRSGKRSIGLTGHGPEDSGAWVSNPISCEGGDSYTLYAAYYQKALSPDGGLTYFIRFLDEDGNYLDDYYQESGEVNYHTITRRNGLPYENLMAAFAMEENESFAYALKQYYIYILYEMKWRIENNDDSTQAVHLGRMMQGCALAYDLLAGYNMLSEEEDRLIHSYMYYLGDKLMDQSFFRHDNDQDRSHNFNADRVAGLLSTAACFPEWSKSDEYIDYCIDEINYIFGGGGISFGKRGEWLECLRYQDAVSDQLFGSFMILKRMRGIDMFESENIKKFCKYPTLVQTPKDAANQTYPNFAGSPQIGNSLFSEGSVVMGRAAAVYKDIDPELSAELAYAWKRAGSMISAYHSLSLLTSFNSDLPQKKMILGSDYFESNGYITFRENYGIDGRENYFLLIGKDTGYGSHQDPDRGSFSLWANNTCIAQDPGVGAYDAGDSTWFRDSGAHNMVTFYETDTSDKTINGVDTKVEDVYLSEAMDYARINGDDTKNTYDYTRHVAFVKNGFSAYVLWDNIENSSRRSRFNLHTISTHTDVTGNKLTSKCYNNMVLDTVVLNETEPDSEIEWGRMTGGYPKVMTDISDQPIEAAEHIKITNPKNKDFITLMYPRKTTDRELTTQTLYSDENGISAYKISKNSDEYFIVIVNNSANTQSAELEAGLRNARTGEKVDKSVNVGGREMLVLFPDTVEEIEPVSIDIDGADAVDIPASDSEMAFFSANIFDNYNNTMPKRKILWSISGDTQDISINENGTLSVGKDAVAGGSVIVTAKVEGTDIADSMTVRLSDTTGLSYIEITGPAAISAPSNIKYTAKYLDKYGREIEGFRTVWALLNPVNGVTINSDGVLTVASGVPNGTRIEIIASYASDLTKNARLIVTVGDAGLGSVEITGPDSVSVPGKAKYGVSGKDVNGNDYDISGQSIEFSLKEDVDGVSISPDGNLIIDDAPYGTEITIMVRVGGTVTAEKKVTIKEFVASDIKILGKTTINAPASGTLKETYSAVVYDQNGAPMDETAKIIMEKGQGVSFDNNTLSVIRHTVSQTITLHASFENLSATLDVKIINSNSSDGLPSFGSGGSGGGGGGSAGAWSGFMNTGDLGLNTPAPDTASTPVPAQNNGFTDLSGYEWASEAIEYLHTNGIVNGKSDTIFAPADNITRAEFVTMLVNAFEINGVADAENFIDVLPEDWYYDSVRRGRSVGIVEGDNNRFEPSRNITREEMAAMVYRTLMNMGDVSRTPTKPVTAFTDDFDIASWAKESVDYMQSEGIIIGFEDNSFRPAAKATRAEAAIVIYRIIKR